MYTHTYIYIFNKTQVICICICLYMYIYYTFTHVFIYLYVYIQIYTYIHICIRAVNLRRSVYQFVWFGCRGTLRGLGFSKVTDWTFSTMVTLICFFGWFEEFQLRFYVYLFCQRHLQLDISETSPVGYFWNQHTDTQKHIRSMGHALIHENLKINLSDKVDSCKAI